MRRKGDFGIPWELQATLIRRAVHRSPGEWEEEAIADAVASAYREGARVLAREILGEIEDQLLVAFLIGFGEGAAFKKDIVNEDEHG